MGVCCCKEEEIDFDSEIELSHFHLLRSVGKGAFGKVRVVQHKKSKIMYALKYINKEKCIRMRAIENIIQERRILEEIEYPLVCNLRYAFQDDENMFMVLDLMLGGDLRFHLERQGCMKENVVKFYVAEISLGLDYLHSKKIVHRDLKPDNVLLDEKGHAHLTDFNIAVHYRERRPLTSIAGSMAYMAPEMLKKKGYHNSVDWWSLGILTYELLFSKRPFRGKTNQQLTNAILQESLQFPDHVTISEECTDVIKRFCERDVTKRLGCNGLEEIKKHPWFKDIEWDKLSTKEAKPLFVPDPKRANFDATHELEELLLEENPLKAKKRANPNQDLSELSKEVRAMEEKFLVYDYTKMERKSYYNLKHVSSSKSNGSSQSKKEKSDSKNNKGDSNNNNNNNNDDDCSNNSSANVACVDDSKEKKIKGEILTNPPHTSQSRNDDDDLFSNNERASKSITSSEVESFAIKNYARDRPDSLNQDSVRNRSALDKQDESSASPT